MIEVVSIAVAIAAYALHEMGVLPQSFLVALLVIQMFLVGWRAPFQKARARGIFAGIKLLVSSPKNMAIASAATLYGYSFLTLTFLSQTSFEIGLVRPSLFEHLVERIAEGAFWVTVGVSIMSFVSRLRAEHQYNARYQNRSEAGNLDYRRVLSYFAMIEIAAIGVRVYAYSAGWTNFISETGFSDIFGALAVPASIVSGFGFFMPAALMAIYFQSKSKAALGLAVASWFFELSFGAVYGQKAAIVGPSLAVFFAVIYYSKRMPLAKLVLVVSMLTPLLVVATGARIAAYKGSNAGDVGVTNFLLEAAEFGFAGSDSYGTGGDLGLAQYLLSRFNIAVPLLAAISHVGKSSPTYDPGPYLNAVLALVPSFMFPLKPAAFDQNEFGRSVGLINSVDFRTSVRPSIFGDLYYNFGGFGVIAGSLIVGLFIRTISGNRIGGMRDVFVLYCCFVFFDAENSLSNVLGGIVKAFVVFYLIEILSRRHRRWVKVARTQHGVL